MDEGTPPEPEGSFVDYQTTMVKFSKAIAITAQEMVSYPCLSLCFFYIHINLLWEYLSVVLQRHESASVDDTCSLCCQMTKSVTCPEELGALASQVTVDYGQLAHQGRLAAATAEPEEVRSHTLCAIYYIWKITYASERFTLCINLGNCAPEMSNWNISFGLYFTPKMSSDISTHTPIRCLLFFEMLIVVAAPDSVGSKKNKLFNIHQSPDLHLFLKYFL